MYATVELSTPVQESEAFESILAATKMVTNNPDEAIARQGVCPVTGQKLGSMGKPVAVETDGPTVYLCCAACKDTVQQNPQKYISRIQTVSDDGVLAVPESAVIDTGAQRIVYVEREEGVYEGVEVKLGPKTDGYYSVISGLLPGDRVAAAGAFLIDAETRLNPAASASYFGASGGEAASSTHANTADDEAAERESSAAPEKQMFEMNEAQPTVDFAPSRLTPKALAQIAKLPLEEQTLAKLQVLCPVTLEPLGSMGKPLKVSVQGDTIFVCCKGCPGTVQSSPERMLQQVRRWREGNARAAGTHERAAGPLDD
jgi:YHS domain-containing protein